MLYKKEINELLKKTFKTLEAFEDFILLFRVRSGDQVTLSHLK